MTKAKEPKPPTVVISPPGKIIKELMESRGVDPIDLSYELKITQRELNDLLIGELPLTPEMGETLGKVFNVLPNVWLESEEKYQNEKS